MGRVTSTRRSWLPLKGLAGTEHKATDKGYRHTDMAFEADDIAFIQAEGEGVLPLTQNGH